MPLPTVNYKELEALKAEDTEEAKTELAKLVRPISLRFSSISGDFRMFRGRYRGFSARFESFPWLRWPFPSCRRDLNEAAPWEWSLGGRVWLMDFSSIDFHA